MLNKRPSILFLSTGDATRSRIAGAFFRSFAGEKYDVVSTAVKSDALHPLASVDEEKRALMYRAKFQQPSPRH
jgi:protein-tyrosine-phosphatase